MPKIGKRVRLNSSGRIAPITENELLQQPRAREAFEFLTNKKGVSRDRLLSLLCTIPQASAKKQPLVQGMTERTLRALPAQISGWADTVERVNASRWIDPTHLVRLAKMKGCRPEFHPKPLGTLTSPGIAEPAADTFLAIPRILRGYAEYLGTWLETMTFIKWSRRGFRRRQSLILDLMCMVEVAAGRPCLKQIAELVTAAFSAAGQQKAMSEGDLTKLKKNNPLLSMTLDPRLW